MKTLKTYILEEMDQISIYSKYMNILENEIQDSINSKINVKSPYREDPNHSVSFRYYGNKLICTDFGDVDFRGDVFEIVGIILSKNSRDAKEFIEICEHIINHTGVITRKSKILDQTNLISDPTQIDFISRMFNTRDFKHFWQYGIKSDIVKEAYIPVKRYSINGFESLYRYEYSDPCYAYSNNPDTIKLSFPFRKQKNDVRFITNNKIPLELITTLRRCRFTILIKAYKDKLLMDDICNELNITDTQFIPVASETTRLPKNILSLLKMYTTTKLFTLFDLDKCGMQSAMFYKKEYGMDNIIIGTDYTTKDPTDFVKKFDRKPLIKLFKELYECF